MAADYAFLVLEDHPYGREMLQALLSVGQVPRLVIEECSAIATEEREKFLERMRGFAIAPTLRAQLSESGVERHQVPNHNDPRCAEILRAANPALLVLGGTRILRDHVIDCAPYSLNAHPGLLPEVRGSASVAWAIEKDIPVGCTCHYIDTGVDTGPIVSRETIPVHREDSYEKLCWETTRLSARLMASAVTQFEQGKLDARPQPREGNTYRNMPPEGVARMKAKLAAGEYLHFVD
jgi:methionyl-tRNA formyltransferase